MNRKISVERLYTVAEYQNIKFSSEIGEVPDDVVLSKDAVDMLFYGQALECDIAYKRYMELRNRMINEKVTDTLSFLKEERKANNEALLAEIKSAIETNKEN